jgi:1,2-phenylacetyl-CoA epoxidase PaaB subunit
MVANTAYEVYLALSPDERERFAVLYNQNIKKTTYDFRKKKVRQEKFTQKDAINLLLGTVFKSKK